MKRPRGVFIGGTGTEVGKTVFSILLLAHLRGRGLRVAPMKPAETGCSPDPSDALALIAASGRSFPVRTVCPYRLALPAAPEAAAEKEGVKVDFNVMAASYKSLLKGADIVVVEGAGAVATPYAGRLTGMDIARKLNIPVILITSQQLGTIGQTLAAVKALKHSRTQCMAVALSSTSAGLGEPHHESNARLIKAHLSNVPMLGSLPYMRIPGRSPGNLSRPAVKRWVRENLKIFRQSLCPALDEVLAL